MHQHKDQKKSVDDYEYSPKIAERRRALFPSDNLTTDDLSDMAPIADGSSDESAYSDQDMVDNNKLSYSIKDSKARAELFPKPDITIPTKSFYSKSNHETSPPIMRHHKRSVTPPKKIRSVNRNKRNKLGEINAGVGHKIQKSKRHEPSKDALLKAAENIIDNSPLNDYLDQVNKVNAVKPLNKPQLNDPDDAALCEYMKDLDDLKVQRPKMISEPVSEQPPASAMSVSSVECDTFSAKKRAHSPPLEDENRKFFKSSRMLKAPSTLRQTKIDVFDGKLSLTKGTSSNVDQMFNLYTSDLVESVPEEPLISSDAINGILDVLDDKENLNVSMSHSQSPTVNEASSSQKVSRNFLLSPTSQVCNLTSNLAIASPRKVVNLTAVLNGMPNEQSKKNTTPKFKKFAKDQMLLDAGQKNFGVTQCGHCKLVYHMGDPQEEIMHLNYHNASHVLRFNGWKNERIVAEPSDGKIIHVIPCDSSQWLKKVKDLLEVVNRDLGYFDYLSNIDNCQVFLYIKKKTIVGCLVAEPTKLARKMLPSNNGVDLCSEESYNVKCGVSRIWVFQANRKQGIATALMNCLKRNFMNGYVLADEDIALSSPTESDSKHWENYSKHMSINISRYIISKQGEKGRAWVNY